MAIRDFFRPKQDRQTEKEVEPMMTENQQLTRDPNASRVVDSTALAQMNAFEDHVQQILVGLKEEYDRIRKETGDTIDSYELELERQQETIARKDNQIKKYDHMPQVRDLMEKILPALSEIRNEILGITEDTDPNELKATLLMYFKKLHRAFGSADVTLVVHDPRQKIEGDEQINLAESHITNDPALHQTVVESRQMGCIIRGYENDPILEEVDLYVYQAPEVESDGAEATETTAHTSVGWDSVDIMEQSAPKPATQPTGQTGYASSWDMAKPMPSHNDFGKTSNSNRNMYSGPAVHHESTLEGENYPRSQQQKVEMTAAPAITVVRVLETIDISIDNEDRHLTHSGEEFRVNEWKRIDLPSSFIKQDCTVYAGTQRVRSFRTNDRDLFCRVRVDEQNRVLLDVALRSSLNPKKPEVQCSYNLKNYESW